MTIVHFDRPLEGAEACQDQQRPQYPPFGQIVSIFPIWVDIGLAADGGTLKHQRLVKVHVQLDQPPRKCFRTRGLPNPTNSAAQVFMISLKIVHFDQPWEGAEECQHRQQDPYPPSSNYQDLPIYL